MSSIRKQSIISSLVIYSGFGVGLINTYFFTKDGLFTPEQYGLISIFINIATLMTSFACLAAPAYIFKFYPYYKDHLPVSKNDMFTWGLLAGIVGFILIIIVGYFLKDLVALKYKKNAPLVVAYYYWVFPLGFGLTMFTILEAYAWAIKKSVLANFLKEVQWRLFTLVLILLFIFGVINNYALFIKIYSFSFLAIATTLLVYFIITRKAIFTFQVSKVSRRFFKNILQLSSMFYLGSIMFTLSQVFDTILIASVLKDGAAMAGIFALAQIMTSIIQAPQRGIVAASVSHLSQAWKDKNMPLIQHIYQRSAINQLIFATAIFLLITLNYQDAVVTLDLNRNYLLGFSAFVFLGFARVVDMGTGVNAEIIATSTKWRFNLLSGMILIVCTIPVTYVLAKQMGIIGPAIAGLIAICIYNTIRIIFLWKKFRLFPLTIQSLYTVLLGGVCYLLCYFIFRNIESWAGLFLRSITFLLLFGTGVFYFKLSPDIFQLLEILKARFKKK